MLAGYTLRLDHVCSLQQTAGADEMFPGIAMAFGADMPGRVGGVVEFKSAEAAFKAEHRSQRRRFALVGIERTKNALRRKAICAD